MAVAPTKAKSTKKTDDPVLDQFKADYDGKYIVDPASGKGYHVGRQRGQFPSWLKEQMQAVREGKLDVLDDAPAA